MKKNEKADIGLSGKSRDKVGKLLNQVLADEYRLSIATKDYHWNVTGPHFGSLHKLFEDHYEHLDKWIDAVAERARAIGIRAAGSFEELTKGARLHATAGSGLSAKQIIEAALDLHEKMIVHLREDVDACADKFADAGTADFLTNLMEYHETTSWMLRALTEKHD